MAAIALLRPLSDRLPAATMPAPPLTPDQALELALLGLVMARPLPVERMADLLRRVVAPLLQPTADVIETRLRRLIRRGLLAQPRPGFVRGTSAGLRHLRWLLRCPPPPHYATHHDLVFMLKVCLLDLLDDEARAAVLAELRDDLRAALAAAEQAAGQCRSASPFTGQWLARQVVRLREDLRWLDGLASCVSPPCPSGK